MFCPRFSQDRNLWKKIWMHFFSNIQEGPPCINKFPSTIMKQQFCQPPTRHQVNLFPPLRGHPFSPACWWRHLPAWALQSPFSASSHRAWSVSTKYSSLSLGVLRGPRWLVDGVDSEGAEARRISAPFWYQMETCFENSGTNIFLEQLDNPTKLGGCSTVNVRVVFMVQSSYCTFVQVRSGSGDGIPKKKKIDKQKEESSSRLLDVFNLRILSLPSWYFCIYQLKNLHSLKWTVRTWKHAISKGN